MKSFTTITKIKETELYLDNQPIYCQPLVTDCIVTTNSIFEAADKYDDNVINFLNEFKPEYVAQYVGEYS